MEPIFPSKFGGDVGKQGNLAHNYPSIQGKPGEQGLNAAVRGTTPHPRAGGQLAHHLSGLRHHSCATARARTLIQENKVPMLCLEFQLVPCCWQKPEAGLQGGTGWQHPPWAEVDTGEPIGPHTRWSTEVRTLWAARDVAAPGDPNCSLCYSSENRERWADRRWTDAHGSVLSWSSPAHGQEPKPTSQLGLEAEQHGRVTCLPDDLQPQTSESPHGLRELSALPF